MVIVNEVRTRGAQGNHLTTRSLKSSYYCASSANEPCWMLGGAVQHLRINLPRNPVKTAAVRLLLTLQSLPVYPHSLSDSFAGISGVLPRGDNIINLGA